MSLVRFRPWAPFASVAHLVERHLAKVEVASSSLVTRSKFYTGVLSCRWRHSQVVRQGSAKSSPPVQIWVAPPKDEQAKACSFFFPLPCCTISYRGVAKFGIALGSGPRGRGFESRHSDHRKILELQQVRGFFVFRTCCVQRVFLTLFLTLLLNAARQLIGHCQLAFRFQMTIYISSSANIRVPHILLYIFQSIAIVDK